jgi:uncharacterized membrane protein
MLKFSSIMTLKVIEVVINCVVGSNRKNVDSGREKGGV